MKHQKLLQVCPAAIDQISAFKTESLTRSIKEKYPDHKSRLIHAYPSDAKHRSIKEKYNDLLNNMKLPEIKRALIISGGEPQAIPERGSFDLVIACDRGLEYALGAGIIPDIVIGDLDSYEGDADPDDFNCIKLPVRKDLSDSHCALIYALEHGCTDITFCCIMGGRLDHMAANMQMAVCGAANGAVVRFEGDLDKVCVFAGKTLKFPKAEGWSFSVLSMTDISEGIIIKNASYPADGITLTNAETRGLSNEWLDGPITVGVHKGILAVIMSSKDRKTPDVS